MPNLTEVVEMVPKYIVRKVYSHLDYKDDMKFESRLEAQKRATQLNNVSPREYQAEVWTEL